MRDTTRRTDWLTAGTVTLAVAGAIVLAGPGGALAGSVEELTGGEDPVESVRATAEKVVREAAPPAREPAAAPAPARAPARSAPVRAPVRAAQQAPAQADVQSSNPHGQGTVLRVDVNPAGAGLGSALPMASGPDDIVIGRSRGEQRPDGNYHGSVTVLGLFGQTVIGNETGPGETRKGPLSPLQEGLLNALCTGFGGNLCMDVLRADSTTTNTGSTNHYKTAGIVLGGERGISLVAAESRGSIQQEGNCQVAHGEVTLVDLRAGGTQLLAIGQSASDSRACPDGTTTTNSQNPLIKIGGQAIPLPGCGAGSNGTLVGLPPLLTILCNATSEVQNGAANDALLALILRNGPAQLVTVQGAGTTAAARPPTPDVLPGGPTASPPRRPGGPEGPDGPSDPPPEATEPRPLERPDRHPLTGADVLALLLAGTLMLLAGLGVRQRLGARSAEA